MTKVQELIRYKMARDAIPSGGGLMDGIRFLSNNDSILNGYKKAEEWVKSAIQVVRLAADPNPWRNSDDETIATELVRQVIERKRKAR